MPKSEVREVRTGHLKAHLPLIRAKDGCILGISALPMLQGIVYSHFLERKMSGHLLLQRGLRRSFRRSGVKLQRPAWSRKARNLLVGFSLLGLHRIPAEAWRQGMCRPTVFPLATAPSCHFLTPAATQLSAPLAWLTESVRRKGGGLLPGAPGFTRRLRRPPVPSCVLFLPDKRRGRGAGRRRAIPQEGAHVWPLKWLSKNSAGVAPTLHVEKGWCARVRVRQRWAAAAALLPCPKKPKTLGVKADRLPSGEPPGIPGLRGSIAVWGEALLKDRFRRAHLPLPVTGPLLSPLAKTNPCLELQTGSVKYCNSSLPFPNHCLYK